MSSAGLTMKRKNEQESKYDKKKRMNPFITGPDGLRPKNCPLSERQQLALFRQMSAGQSDTPSLSATKRSTSTSGKKDKINKRNERGETPLHLATIKGDITQMQELLKQGADINIADYAGWTPLHEACNLGLFDAAQFLLSSGADPNPKGMDDDYPLHDAVCNEHYEIVELLLESGADPHLMNRDGKRPEDLKMNKRMKKLFHSKTMNTKSRFSDSSKKSSKRKMSMKKLKKMKSNSNKQNEEREPFQTKTTKTDQRLFSASIIPKTATMKRQTFSPLRNEEIFSKELSSSSDEDQPLSQNVCRADKENKNNNNNEICAEQLADDKEKCLSLASDSPTKRHQELNSFLDDKKPPSTDSDFDSSQNSTNKIPKSDLKSHTKTTQHRNEDKCAAIKPSKISSLPLNLATSKSDEIFDEYSSLFDPTDVYDFSPGDEDSNKETTIVRLGSDRRISNGDCSNQHLAHKSPLFSPHTSHSNISRKTSRDFDKLEHTSCNQIKSAIDRPPITASCKHNSTFDYSNTIKKERIRKQSPIHYSSSDHKNSLRRSRDTDTCISFDVLPTRSPTKINSSVLPQPGLVSLGPPVKVNGSTNISAEVTNGSKEQIFSHSLADKLTLKSNGSKRPPVSSIDIKTELLTKNQLVENKEKTTARGIDILSLSAELTTTCSSVQSSNTSSKPKNVSEMELAMNNRSYNSHQDKERLFKSSSDPSKLKFSSHPNKCSSREVKKSNSIKLTHPVTETSSKKPISMLLDSPLIFIKDLDIASNQKRNKDRMTKKRKKKITSPSDSSSSTPKLIRLSESSSWLPSEKSKSLISKKVVRSNSYSSNNKKIGDSSPSNRFISDFDDKNDFDLPHDHFTPLSASPLDKSSSPVSLSTERTETAEETETQQVDGSVVETEMCLAPSIPVSTSATEEDCLLSDKNSLLTSEAIEKEEKFDTLYEKNIKTVGGYVTPLCHASLVMTEETDLGGVEETLSKSEQDLTNCIEEAQLNESNKDGDEKCKLECVEKPPAKDCSKQLSDYQKLIKEYILKNHSQPVILSRKPPSLPVYYPLSTLLNREKTNSRFTNPYAERLKINQIVSEKRRRLAPVLCKAPDHFWEYLTYTGSYRLHGYKESELSIPLFNPPADLTQPMQALFLMHEEARTQLRIRHAIEREKLVLSCEQEIMRVHGRAARTINNQQTPYSACSFLLDEEVYKIPELNSLCGSTTTSGIENENKTSIRDRFNKRTFTSWMQDVVDKFEHLKTQVISRQRHESTSLNAVQRSEWSLKLQEITQNNSDHLNTESNIKFDETCVPLVNIGDDFKLLPNTP